MDIANKNYIGVGLVALAIIFAWIFGVPLWDRISALSSAIADRQELFNERNSVITKIAQLNSQYQSHGNDIKKISNVVPSVKSSAELVSALESLAQQSGLGLIGLSTSEQKQLNSDLNILFMEMNVTGNYSALTTFLDAIERNIRLIDIVSIGAVQTATIPGQSTLNFDIKANSYFLNLSKGAPSK